MQIALLDVAKQLWEASQILGKEDNAMSANETAQNANRWTCHINRVN
jgi:hypothetical protein